MGAKSHSAGSGTRWKWFVESASDPQVIPKSWAQNGGKESEPNSEYEELFYALEVKTGLLLEYETDRTGQPIRGPLRERPGLRVLYTTADGKHATVRQIIANEKQPSKYKPAQSFHSVVACDIRDSSTCEHPAKKAHALKKLYNMVGERDE